MSTTAMQKRFSEEFKIEAVRQTTERGHKVADMATRLGVSTWSASSTRVTTMSAARRANRPKRSDACERSCAGSPRRATS